MLGEGVYTDVRGHGHTGTQPAASTSVGLAVLLPSPLPTTQAAGSTAGLVHEAKKGESKLVPLTHRSSINVLLWAGGFQRIF